MSDMKLTQLIRLMLQAHKEKFKQDYPKFPNREWLLAQQRLLELQEEMWEKKNKNES